MKQLILLSHVALGVGCIIATVWVFVDALNARAENLGRIRWMSRLAAAFMWLAFVAGGYWYVVDYKVDKAVILKGPWPFAHNLFMETKEHLFLLVMILSIYLPIAASEKLHANATARKVVLWVALLIALNGLAIEGFGVVVNHGAKIA